MMKNMYYILNKLLILIALMTIQKISYSQNDMNKYARDYIKSSLIINYYSEGRPLFNNINLDWSKIYPHPGYKYLIEIKPFTNSYLTDFKDIRIFEYNFEFAYTSNPKNWNSSLGSSGLVLDDYKEVYADYTHMLVATNEINQLHKKGLILETKEGEPFIINNEEIIFNGLNAVPLKKLDLNTISTIISIRYFHYSPDKISINMEYSSFSFYSRTLNRYFNGRLKYQRTFNSYSFELENGVLVGD